jgi:hypothetical protein
MGAGMKAFVDKHEDRIHGVLSCFDRMLFRGYLPIMSGWSMAQLLKAHESSATSAAPGGSMRSCRSRGVRRPTLSRPKEHHRGLCSNRVRWARGQRPVSKRASLVAGELWAHARSASCGHCFGFCFFP